MGSRLGRRVVNFANIPIKLLMPTSFSNITEIALKTIPSASKIEIKRVLESLYGFEVEKVQTLNMDGKKKKRGGILIAKPDYKKAYVTLRNPLSISPDLFPIRLIEEDKKNLNKQSKSSFVEGDEAKKSHWLEGNGKPEASGGRWRGRDRGSHPGGAPSGGRDRGARQGGEGSSGQVKFPWSSMKSSSRLLLELISCKKQCISKIEQFVYSFGILQGKKGLGVSFLAPSEILPLLGLCTMLQASIDRRRRFQISRGWSYVY